MLRTPVVVACVLMFAGLWPSATAFAQAALPPGTRTITVSGHGEAKAKPDQLVLSFAVESKAASGDECTKLQSEKTAKVVDALKGKLAGKGEITTSNFSLNPINESVPIAASAMPTPVILWQFTESIQAISEKLESVGTLIDAAMAAGADRVQQTSMEEMPVSIATGRIEPNAHFDSGFVGALSAVGRAAPANSSPRYEMRQFPTVTFEIDAAGATAGEAVRLGAARSHRVEQALKARLGNTGLIQVSNFGVNQVNPDNPNQNQNWAMRRQFMPAQPQYVTKQSFQARTNIDVKTSQIDLLGPLLQVAMAAGASQLNQASFTLSSDAVARKQAIAAASSEALTKAQTVANSMGVKLGKVLSISINGQVQPQIIYAGIGYRDVSSLAQAMTAGRRMPVLPHDVGFSADVNAVYEIQ